MGLIRTSLAIGTAGVVSSRSRKQRVSAAQLRELKAHTALLADIADPEAAAARRLLEAQARERKAQRREARRAESREYWAALRARQSSKEMPAVTRTGRVALRVLIGVLGVMLALMVVGVLGAISPAAGGIALVAELIGALVALGWWQHNRNASPNDVKG
ncbi:MAG: hypothetical protein ACRDSH_24005 [Pseudonocardiaceae bacterium]